MQKTSLNYLLTVLRICIVIFIVAIISLVLFSFTIDKINEGFLKQLGITKTEADKKITNSLLGGYMDTYGTKNAKNIAVGNRTAVVKDLLIYTKQYAATVAFKKEYAILKEHNKPALATVQTPAEMQQSTIDQYKKSVADIEASIKKSDASFKPMFEKILADGKKQLKEAEDPNNKTYVRYAKNYPQLVKDNEQRNSSMLSNWEQQYPANHMLFIKQRLVSFLETTKDIDFAAELIIKNGKKVFVNPVYERQKGNYWKMAFRAGKEVVEPARIFAEQWLQEINKETNKL
jgi:hypothetical protein